MDFQNFGPTTRKNELADSESILSMGPKNIARDLFTKERPIRSLLSEYDVIIDTGAGDSFADIYGPKRLVTMMYAAKVADDVGAVRIMSPQTIGPFNSKWSKILASRNLSRAKLVMSRDSESARYCKCLGRGVDSKSSDVVFALPVPEINQKRHDIILNISGLLWYPNPHVDHRAYRSQVVDLADRLRRGGRQITLMGHVIAPDSQIDDDSAALENFNSTTDRNHEIVLPESLTEARTALASAELVFGSRMHACLNAISVGVATIPWAYSRKFSSLFADLGWPYVVELNESSDAAVASLEMIDSFVGRFDSMVQEVNQIGRQRVEQSVKVLSAFDVTRRTG